MLLAKEEVLQCLEEVIVCHLLLLLVGMGQGVGFLRRDQLSYIREKVCLSWLHLFDVMAAFFGWAG